MLQIHIT